MYPCFCPPRGTQRQQNTPQLMHFHIATTWPITTTHHTHPTNGQTLPTHGKTHHHPTHGHNHRVKHRQTRTRPLKPFEAWSKPSRKQHSLPGILNINVVIAIDGRKVTKRYLHHERPTCVCVTGSLCQTTCSVPRHASRSPRTLHVTTSVSSTDTAWL